MSSETITLHRTVAAPKRRVAFMEAMTPNLAFAAIVTHAPLTPAAATEWVWAYIKAKYLQDPLTEEAMKDTTPLQGVFEKASVDMFKVTTLLHAHLV